MTARYRLYLIERYRLILGYTAGIISIIGGFLLMPLFSLFFFPDEWHEIWIFLALGLPLAIGGYWLKTQLIDPAEATSLSVAEGMVIVTIAWIFATFIGAIPFIVISNLNLAQAFFESSSGWTATGLTVIIPQDEPHIILLYRSVLQLAGGAGFAILMVTAVTGLSGAGLTVAEGRTDQLVPHVRRSSTIVLQIYLGYILGGIIALWIAGMTLFEAINHSATAVATGGFSTRSESIIYWDSPLIEIIIMILTILGATNFLTAYVLLQGKTHAFIHNGEVRLMAMLVPASILLIFFSVTTHIYASRDFALRAAAFDTVMAFTTTGFNIATYERWADTGWLIFILLMIIGGGSGSTAGGIKLHRIYGLYKGLRFQLHRAFLPTNTITSPSTYQGENRHFYTDSEINLIGLYTFLYLAVVFIGSLIISFYGFSMKESLFEFSSLLAGVGLSVGVTSQASDSLLWFMAFGMIFGRLEFFTLVIGTIKLLIDGKAFLFSRRT